jgi:uncharacterized membrane protein YoaK (UPF0700 family)
MRVLDRALASRGIAGLVPLLRLQFVLLVVGAALAITLGPFPDGDAWGAVATGMVLVAAMAIQNAVQRLYLAAGPPTTLMTGSTTQIMIDLVDLARGAPADERRAAETRMRRMALNVVGFAAGCGVAALWFHRGHEWCFLAAPALALVALIWRSRPA